MQTHNFKVVQISKSDGAYALVASGLSEIFAWEFADKLGEKQFQEKRSSDWYAVTNSSDWQSMAVAFYRMKTGKSYRRS